MTSLACRRAASVHSASLCSCIYDCVRSRAPTSRTCSKARARISHKSAKTLPRRVSRRERWVLAVRLAGSPALVAADEAGLGAASGGGRFAPLRAEEAHAFWMRLAEGFAVRPVTFRIGGVPTASDELLDLLQHQLGDEWISASPAPGALRWTGDASIDRLQRLRRTLAGVEVPLTLERAPWPLRGAVG